MWFRYPLFCHLLVQIFCFWIVKSQNVTIYCDISTTTSNNNGSLEAPYQTFDDAFIAAADLANSIGILPDSVIQIKLAPGLYNLDESMGGFYAWDGGSSQTASLRISGQNSTISFTEDFLTVGRGPAFEIGFSGSLIFERITFKSAPGQTEWFFATTTADAKLAFDDIFVEGTDVAAYSQTYFVLSNDGGSIALNNAEFGHGACLKTHTVSFAAITSITNLRIVDREYASLFNEVTAGQLVFKNWHLRGLWLDSYSNFVVFATGENARADVANGLLEKHSSLPSDNLVEENTAFDSERLAEIYVTNVTFRDTSVCLVTALYAGNIYAKDITAIGVEKFIDLLFAYNARIELVGAHIENCTGSLNNQGPTAQVVMENVHFINLRNLESPFMYFKGQLGTFIFTFKNVTLEATVPITNPLYMIYLRGGRAQIDGLRLIGLYTCVDSCVHASKMLDFGIKNSLFSGLTLLGSQTLTIEAPPSHVLIDNWTVESIKNGGALVVRAYNTGANISIANSRFVKNKNNPFLVGVNSMAAASATLNIRNTTFAGNYYSRVISLCDGQIRFDNATFWNNTSEENGQVACDMSSGKNSLTILSSLFDGNKGVNGASMYIAGLVNASQVYLRGNVFKNNVALSRSGGWYSTVPSPLPIDLESIYINNTARSGADFSTAAAKLRLVANLSDISGYSGFALPTFSAQAVDIFGQWFYTTIADYAILLDVNVTRANNRSEAAALPGQTTSMIVFGTAEFSNVRILAPPGVYMVTVSHPADTAAIELEPVHIPVTVLPCAYPKRERSVSGYAASECHVPVCPRGCLSTGVCVDDGNCACTSTMYEGWDCSIKAAVNDSAIVTFAVTEQLTFSTSTRDRIFDTLQATFGETYNIIFRQFTQSRSDLMEFKYSLTNKRGEYLTATELSSMSTKAATSLMSSIPSSGEVVARLQTGDLSNTNLQQSVISLVIASIGITAVLLHSMWLYIKRNTGILKSTVMPLNYILNMGIAGMFAFPITDLLLPTRESCTAQVAFMPFSIGLAVPALAAKVIYYRSKYNNRIGVLKGPTTAESNFSTLIAGGLFTVYLVSATT
ncbi:hypothetical protein DFS34DRAFT_603523 [Phlyctochytrium arcticum]|nr:hypothetical protein DFS34DRAFT_603523 [Phlyctochytrium arcticum]